MAVNGDKATSSDEFWLFGYGSLIWKPPPHFGMHTGEYLAGSMDTSDGFGNQDHRGTPEAPGRVVTLIERSFWASLVDAHDSAPDKVWGVAYRIEADHVAEVKDYLDIREINGYSIHYTPFHPASGESGPIRTLVYIGTPDNDQFTGPQDPQALAEHIHASEGPSGLNRDYLLSLEKALDELSPESGDAHITDLSDRVREIEARDAKGKTHTRLPEEPASHEFRKVSSIDEQEETEKA
ncbi:Glutathione-specific gamma-glutamylcyclotransferase [Apiospora sp. TS-2023a]